MKKMKKSRSQPAQDAVDNENTLELEIFAPGDQTSTPTNLPPVDLRLEKATTEWARFYDALFGNDDILLTDETLDNLFARDMLGALRPARSIFETFFGKCQEHTSLTMTALLDMCEVIQQVEGLQSKRLTWINSFMKFLETQQPIPSSSPSPSQSLDLVSSEVTPTTHFAKPATTISFKTALPHYNGQKGQCMSFVEKFCTRLETAQIPIKDYYALLDMHTHKDAHRFLCIRKIDFPNNPKALLQAMIAEFDQLMPDDRKAKFISTFRQMHTEPIAAFKLRFLDEIRKLQMIGKYQSSENDEFENAAKEDFYSRLLESHRLIISSELTMRNQTLTDITIEQMCLWINARLTLNKPEETVTSFNNKNDKCFYCGKNGHNWKSKDGNKICRQAINNKPPCEKFLKWYKKKYNKQWDPARARKNATSSAPKSHEEEKENPVTVAYSTAKIALTGDIRFKSKFEWISNITTITDLGGCENLVDETFVKNELKLVPKKLPQNSQKTFTGIDNHFVADKSIDLKCDFNGVIRTLTFYLVKNLPKKVLIGFPFFRNHGAIFDLSTHRIEIPALKTHINLLSTSSVQDLTSHFCYFVPSESEVRNMKPILSFSTEKKADSETEQIDRAQTILNELIHEYDDVFQESNEPSTLPEIHVPLKQEYENVIFNKKDRPRSTMEKQLIDDNARTLIKQNKARLNPTTKHNLTQVVVQRYDKSGIPIKGRERVCLNMRPVNQAFEHFFFPLPKISEIKETLMSATFFSELDLAQAFQQIKISRQLQDLCSFSTSFGKVSYTVLPFGAEFASEKFQNAINEAFREFLGIFLLIYIDNLIVYTKTVDSHMNALRDIFSICRMYNLKLQKAKCTFLTSSLHTLGFVVSRGRVTLDPKKIEMLRNTPTPTNVSKLRAYLSLLQQFRDVLPHISHVCHPLYAATSTSRSFDWDEKCEKAFQTSKEMLLRELARYEFDNEKQTIVYTDASNHAIAVVLTQDSKLITCVSKTLNKHQKRWSTIEKELLAIAWCCRKLRHFLLGHKFVIKTDHKPLIGLFKKVDHIENQRLLTMVLSTSEFDFELQHVPGSKNVVADFGSRLISASEYPEDSNLNEDFVFTWISEQMVYPIPNFTIQHLETEDYEQLSSYKTEKRNEKVVYFIHNKPFIYVPKSFQRAFFWSFHFPRHFGITKMIENIKEAGYSWPRIEKKLQEYLTQCACANKNTMHHQNTKSPNISNQANQCI
jgi:RNase H-like domain found in reverse transcriptase/Reverse transcriptase (RNA-dependent DNA polymerase)